MNSQNRMNAGAEYVLYRIWATLQDRDGIHAESLLACMGALAGYACQAYARHAGAAAARNGAGFPAPLAGKLDVRKLALTSISTGNGCTYMGGDALDVPLIASPLSVWALTRRSLQKLHAPLPDIEDISAHVTRTLGTSEFGVPRVGEGHRPRALPIVYLTQLWPQVLPIAQRFCRRPAQLPVLFGIALQRAIENTTGRLDPTLAASIAMECAIAMSKVTLPASPSELPDASGPTRLAGRPATSQAADIARTAIKPKATSRAKTADKPTATGNARTSNNSEITGRARTARRGSFETGASKRRQAVGLDSKTLDAGAFRLRMPPAKVAATIMSLAILTITSFAWQREPNAESPAMARLATGPRAAQFRTGATKRPFEQLPSLKERAPEPVQQQASFDTEAPAAEEMPPMEHVPPPSPDDTDLPAPPPDMGEGIIAEEWQSA